MFGYFVYSDFIWRQIKVKKKKMENVNKMRIWTSEETRAFLKAYISRKDEFRKVRKKKFAMQNVLSDLETQDVLNQTTTVDMLCTKLRNLVRAYKQSIEKNRWIGSSSRIARFGDMMEEILENNPITFKSLPFISDSTSSGNTFTVFGEKPLSILSSNVESNQKKLQSASEQKYRKSYKKEFVNDKRIWTSEETRAFLNAYISRKEEFRKVRQKKFAMQNVLLDLESQGILSQPTTVHLLSTKLKNLIRAYKQGIENSRRTSTSVKSPYATLLEEIVADNRRISNNIHHPSYLYEQTLSNSPTLSEEQSLHSSCTNVETDQEKLPRKSALCNRDVHGNGQGRTTCHNSPKLFGKYSVPLSQQKVMGSIDKPSDEAQNSSDSRIWTRRETKAFLRAYISRKEEFRNVRKKKFAMQNVLLDLKRKGVFSQTTTVDMLSTKFKNLISAYKQGIDNSRRTNTTIKAPFGSLMEEIFKDNPIICNHHSIKQRLSSATTVSDEQEDSIEQLQSARNRKNKPFYKKEIFVDRRIWTSEETEAFLNAYISRKDEFRNVRKKKFAMQNVLSDLENEGVLSQKTTVDMLSTKFRNLTRAYKQEMNNTKRRPTAPCRAPFADLMDEIFADNASISKIHTVICEQPLNNMYSLNEVDQKNSHLTAMSECRHPRKKPIFRDRRIWTMGETEAFLCAYISRKDEFQHVRSKKFAMQNVLLDLESQGVLSQPTTVDMLTTKFKNLARTYKQSIDNKTRTDASPYNGPFADLMEEVFGRNPITTNEHFIYLNGQPLSNTSIVSEEESIDLQM